MQIYLFPSWMVLSEEAARTNVVLWSIIQIFQMVFLGKKCFHTTTNLVKRVKYYFPGKVQDGVLLAKGRLWAGQRGKRFPATSSSARLSVVGSLLIYFVCARIYIGVLPASEDVSWQTREPARQSGFMQLCIYPGCLAGSLVCQCQWWCQPQ